jgi:hypothetical protein
LKKIDFLSQLTCQVDANPAAKIIWLKNKHEPMGSGETLKILTSNMLNDKNMDISCLATSSGFEPIIHDTSILRYGEPTLIGADLYFVNMNEDHIIEFKALSNPSYQLGPKCVKLAANLNEENEESKVIVPIVRENASKYEIAASDTTNDQNQRSKSTLFHLKIKNINQNDLGFYKCIINNRIGSSDLIVELRAKSNYNHLIVTITSSILLFLLALILLLSVVIIFCYFKVKKNRKKNKKKNKMNVCDILPNGAICDEVQTSYTKSSPNLSVTEWITTSSSMTSSDKQSDIQSDKSNSSSQKNLLYNNTNSINNNSNVSSYKIRQKEEEDDEDYITNCQSDWLGASSSTSSTFNVNQKKFLQSISNEDIYKKVIANVYSSKLQTNV